MNRKRFLESVTGISIFSSSITRAQEHKTTDLPKSTKVSSEENVSMRTDLFIAGGGLGGVATALAALRNGLSVIMTEETDWIGGQLSSQGVPPDEHPWIETHGAPKSYRDFRNGVRKYYQTFYSYL